MVKIVKIQKISVLFFLISFLAIACDNAKVEISEETSDSKTEAIDPNKIQKGPLRRDSLTEVQTKRIKNLQIIFSEVFPSTLEEWIDDFKRDLNPDREIVIWEAMATAYKSYCSGKNLNLEIKKEVFTVVLMRSGSSEENVLKQINMKFLSKDEAKKVMAGFKLEAKPIRVIKE